VLHQEVINSGGSRLGGLGPLTFCPGPTLFHRPPRVFQIEPPIVINRRRLSVLLAY